MEATRERSESSHDRRRRPRSKQTSKPRKRSKLADNLIWFAGGLAIGLPLLAVLLFALSRF
jgi:hypothetical protein